MGTPTTHWRLLRDGAGSGPWNMGVDEALLASARASGVASLRFYQWRGPWLSLGYAQSLNGEHLARLRAARVGLVRRTTGGRAVLHGSDLTYAVAAPVSRLPPGLQSSYGLVADAILDALLGLGVPVSRSPADAIAPGRELFDCFRQAAPDEICLAGRKLAGSAQRRAGGALLQHGSIRLAADPEPAVAACAGPSMNLGGTSLLEHGFQIAPEGLEEAIVGSLGEALAVDFEVGRLEPRERRAAFRRRVELERVSADSGTVRSGPLSRAFIP